MDKKKKNRRGKQRRRQQRSNGEKVAAFPDSGLAWMDEGGVSGSRRTFPGQAATAGILRAFDGEFSAKAS